MKEISIRHNKNYDTIMINHITRNNLLEANKQAQEQKRATVVKPSKKGWETYQIEYRESAVLASAAKGKQFSIMGVTFTMLDKRDRDYKIKSGNDIFYMFQGQSLIEDIYKRVTGSLLFF